MNRKWYILVYLEDETWIVKVKKKNKKQTE